MPDAAALEHLRGVLVDAGYAPGRLRDLLHAEPTSGLLSFDPLVHARRLDPGEPLSLLVSAFLFGAPVDERRLRAVVGAACLKALVGCGLVERDGERVHARAEIHPWQHLLLFCDPSSGRRHEDQVLGLTPASVTLAHLTVRRSGGSALDLGCGCGTEALLAAAHSATVAATDINPRAVAFTELNARLNGLSNVEPRVGSWFEPVAGRRFDRIVSNPPYVISPEDHLVYRDGGLPGDALCERVVRDVADHLAEGGFGTVLCNWICRAGDETGAAPLRWVEGTGCDAVVLQYGADEPLTYAASFNTPLRDADGAAFAAALDRWLAYYRALGVEAIGSGAVVLRRTGGAGWAKVIEASAAPTGSAGAHLERLFRAHDWLAGDDRGERLLRAALCPAGAHRVDHTLAYGDGRYSPGAAVLRTEPGPGLEGLVDPRLMGILLRCDGRRTLEELIHEAVAAQPADLAALTRACVATMGHLVGLGFLEPAAPGAD